MTIHALESAAVLFEEHLRLTHRTNQNVQKLFTNRHLT